MASELGSTTGQQVTGQPRTRQLSAGECQTLLREHHEGRLRYQTGRGPRSVVVSYAMSEDKITMQLPDYNDASHYAPGAEVRLEVDECDGRHQDTVSVTGVAELMGPRSRERLPVMPSSAPRTSLVTVSLARLNGTALELAS